MSKESWFVYEEAIVDGLEHGLIELIRSFINTLSQQYKHVYLLRNDERTSDLKLHDFGNSITHYAGFMPDFVLYLQNEEFIYQIYIEPKGNHLLDRDQWKETLLSKINPENIEIVGETTKVKIYGVRFYVTSDARNLRGELSTILNNGQSLVEPIFQ